MAPRLVRREERAHPPLDPCPAGLGPATAEPGPEQASGTFFGVSFSIAPVA